MKIQLTQGCICDTLTIDGKEYVASDYTIEEKSEIIHKLVDRLVKRCVDGELDADNLDYVINDMVMTVGDYEYIGTCEQCGDSIITYGAEI